MLREKVPLYGDKLIYSLHIGSIAAGTRVATMLQVVDRNEFYIQFRDNWDGFSENDLDVLEAFTEDLHAKSDKFGADRLVAWMQRTLSHTLRLTEAVAVEPDDPDTLPTNYRKSFAS